MKKLLGDWTDISGESYWRDPKWDVYWLNSSRGMRNRVVLIESSEFRGGEKYGLAGGKEFFYCTSSESPPKEVPTVWIGRSESKNHLVEATFHLKGELHRTLSRQSIYELKIVVMNSNRERHQPGPSVRENYWELSIRLNENLIFEGSVWLPAYAWPSLWFPINSDYLRIGENTITIENLTPSTEVDSSPLMLQRAELFEEVLEDFTVVQAPEFVRTGASFPITFRVLQPYEVQINCGDDVVFQGESPVHLEPGEHRLYFKGRRAGANVKIQFVSGNKIAEHNIKQIIDAGEKESEVKTGLTLCDVSHEDTEEMPGYLKLIERDSLGNFVAFWPIYWWNWPSERIYRLSSPMPTASGSDPVSIVVPFRFPSKWARLCREYGLYFAIIPKNEGGMRSNGCRIWGNRIKELRRIAGDYFLGGGGGEWGGWMVAWGVQRAKECDMQSAHDLLIREIREWEIDPLEKAGFPSTMVIDATTLNRYVYEAGADVVLQELVVGHAGEQLACIRGAARAFQRDWGCHIAIQWYCGVKCDDPAKYRRWRISLYLSYLSGARYISCENSLLRIVVNGRFDFDSEVTAAYRDIQKEFYNFTVAHPRKGKPLVRIGFVHGNLDSWTGRGHRAAIWGLKSCGPEWQPGPPEESWEYLKIAVPSLMEDQPDSPRGSGGWFSGSPYGQVDVVPSEASLEALEGYGCLIFLGWNTMTPILYEKLKDYVEGGGVLLMGVPHLSTRTDRKEDLRLLHDGDFKGLFGLEVLGKGNRAKEVRILEDTELVDLPSGSIFPIEGSSVNVADVQVTTAKVLATDKDGLPVLTENRRGKGKAYLLTTWCYPGENGISSFMKRLVEAVLKEKQGDVKLRGGDGWVNFAVYARDDSVEGVFDVYLLNTDWRTAGNVKECVLTVGNREIPLKLKEGDMRIVTYREGVIVIPSDKWVYVEGISRREKEYEVAVQGRGEKEVEVYLSEGKPADLKFDRKPLEFEYDEVSGRITFICDLRGRRIISIRIK